MSSKRRRSKNAKKGQPERPANRPPAPSVEQHRHAKTESGLSSNHRSQNNEQQKYTLVLDLNVLNHLGLDLYSSTPAAISEMIANSWDADAHNVRIKLDTEKEQILVEDDGHGMSPDDLRNKFLKVGYARRDVPGGGRSPNGRYVMGRKGIGKLAMFSLADEIEITSQKSGSPQVRVRVDVPKLKAAIREGRTYELDVCEPDPSWPASSGTRIQLRRLRKSINKTGAYLRPRLARRFSIIGPEEGFSVELDEKTLTPADRGFHRDLQCIWCLDEATKHRMMRLATNLGKTSSGKPMIELLDSATFGTDRLQGFIATVDKPAKLRKQEANINQISLFANGRVFQEDILVSIQNSGVFNSYLIGEVYADYLDRDDIDRATSSREALKSDDDKVIITRTRIQDALRHIATRWDEWRRELTPIPDSDPSQKILTNWIDGIDRHEDKALAKRLIASISHAEFSNDEEKDRETRRSMYKSTIVGFEKLRLKNRLERLGAIRDVKSPEFFAALHDVEDIEAAYFSDVLHIRLEVIDRLAKIIESNELEKVAEAHVFNNLWLIDPGWDRADSGQEMELTLTDELKRVDPHASSGARLDIAFRASTGRQVIVELKRPGKAVDVYDLIKQGSKYRRAMQEYLRQHPDVGFHGRPPLIDVLFLVERLPTGEDDVEDELRKHSMVVITYAGLLNRARRAYREYIQSRVKVSGIDEMLKHL